MGLFEVGVEVGGSDVGVNGFFVGLVDVDGEDVGSKVGRIVSFSVGLLDGILVSGAGVTGFEVGIVELAGEENGAMGIAVGCSVGIEIGSLVLGSLVGLSEGITVVGFKLGLSVCPQAATHSASLPNK